MVPGDPIPQTDFRIASPDYFATIGMPLVRGRLFREGDREDAPPVAVVNQAMAHHYWSGPDPVGARVSTDEGRTWRTVVGVVGDVKQYGLDKPAADELYFPYAQRPPLGASLLVRTAGDPMGVARALRDVIYAIDPEQPVADVRTLEQVRNDSLSSPRLTATLLMLFAGVALTITAAGIAGCSPSRSANARRSSASAWRSAPGRARCLEWSWVRECGWCWSALPSDSGRRWRRRA